eukprot:4098402-Prorocentrum_lima.AAC.1
MRRRAQAPIHMPCHRPLRMLHSGPSQRPGPPAGCQPPRVAHNCKMDGRSQPLPGPRSGRW